MRERTWQLKKPKPKPKPKPQVTDEVRQAVDIQAAKIVKHLKKRFRKPGKQPLFNWSEDLITRWHRDALYFIVIMRTPHGLPPTFESRAARMEHAGNGKFNLAVPIRQGWATVKETASADECLKVVGEYVDL